MGIIIQKFYEDNGLSGARLEKKIELFSHNEDIAGEFEYWIKNKKYNKDNPVVVEGYTAEKLAKTSIYLNGEGAFIMLIELRNNPERAQKRIADGFKRK